MPFAKRNSLMNETVRNHPVIVATTAASGGVLLGAFVVFQLFAAPQPQHLDGTAQAAVETKAAPTQVKAQAETTGSAPASESDASKVASSECDQQTWPYLSRACIEETRAKKGGPRVVSTDKLDKPTVAAIETPPQSNDDVALAAPAPAAPAVSSPTPPVVAPAIATVDTPKPTPEAAPAGVAAATTPEPPAATPPEPAAAASGAARTNSAPATSGVKEAAASETSRGQAKPSGNAPPRRPSASPNPSGRWRSAMPTTTMRSVPRRWNARTAPRVVLIGAASSSAGSSATTTWRPTTAEAGVASS